MNRLELLVFITEKTNDPIGAIQVAKNWESFINDEKQASVDIAEPVEEIPEKPAVVFKTVLETADGGKRYKKDFTRTLRKDIYPNIGTHWSQSAINKATAGLTFGLTYQEIGQQIGRSAKAVRDKHANGEIPGVPKYDPSKQNFNKSGRTEKQLEKVTRNLL